MGSRSISTDVLVVGGGSAGVMAAVAAARNGQRVVLAERYGYLGGMATAGMVSTFCGFYTCGPEQRQIVRGLGDELVRRLRERGAVLGPVRSGHYVALLYDAAALKLELDRLVVEAGVQPLFHAIAVDAVVVDGRVRGVAFHTKSGALTVYADVVVDATGDGDVAALAGAPFEKDPDLMQCGSLMFRMGGVDLARFLAVPRDELAAMIREANASGAYDIPREDGNIIPLPRPGEVVVAFSRVHVDGTDVESLSRAELEGRRQVAEIARFLRERVPGFERAYVTELAPQVGIRETRRILGDYQLTGDDVRGARTFPDAIAQAAWPVEYHRPGTRTTEVEPLPGDQTYDIPYRCLLPRGVENLLVAGRCLSATREALASARVMGSCMAMGQAAGTAAALARQTGRSPRQLDRRLLQERLLEQGADLGLDRPGHPARATDPAGVPGDPERR